MTRRLIALFISLGFLASFSHSDPLPLEKRVIEKRLANGITLLMLERHYAPMVSVRMMFRVGSVDETSGKTGLAHMFEHMMFKGTPTWGTRNYAAEAPLLKKLSQVHERLEDEKQKRSPDATRIDGMIKEIRQIEAQLQQLIIPNELWDLYERQGAVNLNAQTSADYTQYVLDIPSNKIELWAMLDSDRVRNPVFRQFYSERDVVKEERRMRVDNDPPGKLYENFKAAALLAHPYRTPVIGWEADLDHLQMSDLEAFYHQHYRPENLTIAIVGDINPAQTAALVEKYFGPWSPPSAPAPAYITEEPMAMGGKTIHVQAESQPGLLMGFPMATYPDPDHPIFAVVAQLLTTGTSSRLYKEIVQKREAATGVDAYVDIPGARYPNLFSIEAATQSPMTNEKLEELILKELDKFKKKPVEAWELQKVRAMEEVGFLKGLQSNGGMASALVYHQCIFGDWRVLLRYQEKLQKMTPEDVQRVAQRLFNPATKTVGYLETKR